MGKWYYEQSGNRIGPVDLESMQNLLMMEIINRNSLVWNDDFGPNPRRVCETEIVPDPVPYNAPPEQDALKWFYEKNGSRVGPVSGDTMSKLVNDKAIDRYTLVWNSSVGSKWVPLNQTTLAAQVNPQLSSEPPALPATAISQVWGYALATFPAWGMALLIGLLVAYINSPIHQPLSADQVVALGGDPQGMVLAFRMYPVPMTTQYYLNMWWVPLAFFVAGNVVFCILDEQQLKRAGIGIAGGAALAAVLVPVYLFVRGRALARIDNGAAWVAYVPLVLWVLSLPLSAVIQQALLESMVS